MEKRNGNTRYTSTGSNKCCRRVPHVYNIGYAYGLVSKVHLGTVDKGGRMTRLEDQKVASWLLAESTIDLSGQPVHLDIGRCTADCESLPSTEPPYISVLERIRGYKRQSSQLCKSNDNARGRSTCEPSKTHAETITFNSGPKFYDVIDRCVCRRSPKKCERIPKLKAFFVGTKYEATVDVGECIGRCKDETYGKQCRPTRFKPHPVTGPNGMMSVDTVSECRCESACFRQQFNVALTELKEDENGKRQLSTKVVDVGRCVGTCSPIEHCVVRSTNRKNSKCLMSLETTDVTCAPTRVHDVTYIDRYESEKRITQIRRCGCT